MQTLTGPLHLDGARMSDLRLLDEGRTESARRLAGEIGDAHVDLDLSWGQPAG